MRFPAQILRIYYLIKVIRDFITNQYKTIIKF